MRSARALRGHALSALEPTCGGRSEAQQTMSCSQRCPQQTLFRKFTHKGTSGRV